MTMPSENRGKVCNTRPDRTSQSLTVLSELAEAIRRAVGRDRHALMS